MIQVLIPFEGSVEDVETFRKSQLGNIRKLMGNRFRDHFEIVDGDQALSFSSMLGCQASDDGSR